MDSPPLLEDIIVSLQKEKVRQDSFDDPDHSYKIETRIEFNERECCFNSVVTYNGFEITDDHELIKETFCRKSVAEISKAKALSNLLVKEAATLHFERCEAVGRRLRKNGRAPLRVNRNRVLVLMMVFAVAIVLSAVYFLRPPVQPTRLPHDVVETPPPVALPLDKSNTAPSSEAQNHLSGTTERTPPPDTVKQVLEKNDSAKSTAGYAGSSDAMSPSPGSTSMDQPPEPSPQKAEEPQVMRNPSPEEIKARVRSILEKKTESP